MIREHKFVSGCTTPDAVLSVLRAFCKPDGAYPEGDLESIYFDDPMLTSYWEKANGDSLKRKVRIRWYHGEKASAGEVNAFFEIKDRIGAARDKFRYRFKAPVDVLLKDEFASSGLIEIAHAVACKAGVPMNGGLVPLVAIRYNRCRFLCPQTGSRVNVDWNIRVTRANRDIFPYPTPVGCPMIVCEAKSDTFRTWPFCADLMRLGFRMESFSKYGYLVGKLLQGGFI